MVTSETEEDTEPDPNDFWVRFWGVRGTIPCADPLMIRYGGNTACVEVNCAGRTVIFDLGSGAPYLAQSMLDRKIKDADIFLSHAHFDHVMGLPFFWPFYRDMFSARIWSGELDGIESTKALVASLMQTPFLPITPAVFSAGIEYRDIKAGDRMDLGDGIIVTTTALNHPGGCTGYRVDFVGKSVCYISDTEHVPGSPDLGILKLIEHADIVIYDATYTDEEYLPCRGYGHSTWRAGAALCDSANAGLFVPYHHHTEHNDDFMDAVAEELTAQRPNSTIARERLILKP